MMDMRSTLGNTARAAQNARCDEYNIQLIEVSSHMGARPLCAPYQGRIFSRDGSKGVTTDGAGGKIYYTPLSETSYGQPAGLFGINCGHVQYPFVPGINFQRYFPYPKEENDRRYMQFQQQRAMERGIRAAKRECMMLQETGDTEGLQKASLRLRNQREKYKAYCKETGLKQHNDRTQVYGYDRSKSSKTIWAEKKVLNQKYQQRMHDLGINNPPKSLDKFNEMKYNNTPEYQVLSRYISSVESGMLSPLVGFDKYKEYYENIENNVIGKTTSNGIVITGHAQHFLERIFGTKSDPNHNGMPRSGVALDDAIDALLNGKERPVKEEILPDGAKRRSQLFYNKKCSVSINPDTGIIIQCQPN